MRTMNRERGLRRASASRRGLLREVALVAAACAVLGAGASSCSLISQTSSDQCEAVSECAGFPGLRQCDNGVCGAVATPPACASDDECKSFASAVCTSGVCVRGSCTNDADCGSTGVTCSAGKCTPGGVTKECTSSMECVGKGAYYVCRKEKCQSLVNELCTTVYTTQKDDKKAYLDDTAVFFGSILPTVGGDGEYGTLVEDAIKLAIDDFAKVNGIPSATNGGSNRPLVLVGCHDGEDEDRTDEAAHHLIDDLGVPAILGYAFSGNTISLATGTTITDDVLLFSPSATSNDITMLDDKDLVWRTSPRDDFQAAALALYYNDVEAKVKVATGATDVKVAILHNNDPYGSGLADVLQSKIMINGKPATDQANANFYKRLDYGDPPNLVALDDIAKNFAPHVIFLFGFNEGPDEVFPAIEGGWTATDRPQWILSDGGQVPSLWNKAITTDDQRGRVTGSVPGANTSYQPYSNFRFAWNGSAYAKDDMGNPRSPDTIGPAGAYDIFYMFAYSAVAVGSNPLTGPNMVKQGLRKMVPGMNVPKVTIGPLSITATFAKLTAGTAIDIEGSSGPLDFDQFGEARSDIQVWCVPKGAAPTIAAPAIYSGRYYDSATDKMAGAIDAACALP